MFWIASERCSSQYCVKGGWYQARAGTPGKTVSKNRRMSSV
jgi:hypothetical protein